MHVADSTRILVFAFVLIAGCAGPGQDRLVVDRRGALVLVGGGGTPKAVVQKAIALSGGEDCDVLIVPQASLRPEAGKASAKMFRDAGARNVRVFQPAASGGESSSRPTEADAAQLAEADLIWMPGGDQNRLMRRLEAAGVVETIRERHRDGAVVGGTSAGAAVASQQMLTGEAMLDGVVRGGTTLADGLGVWPGVIVDQHFQKRRRFNRLLSAVLDHPDCIGIGIDERTAVIVRGLQCEVMGDGSVVLIDARRADVRAEPVSGLAGASNVRIDICEPGRGFTIDAGVRANDAAN